jgi:organic hydroperoxide reductase OsmC/OhrA
MKEASTRCVPFSGSMPAQTTIISSQGKVTSMSKMVAKAKTFWEGGLKTNSIIRGFEVGTDKPKGQFGTNTAAAPAELFLASISACFLSTFAFTALMKRMKLKEITSEIKGSLDMEEGSERIIKISLSLKVWADHPDEKQLKACFNAAQKQCSLTKSLQVPIDFHLKIKQEK